MRHGTQNSLYGRGELDAHVPYPRCSGVARTRTKTEAEMRRTNWMGCIVGAVVIVLSASGSAHAQTATFSRIDDAQGSRFIDPATTRVDTVDRNKLVIGFHKGLDSATL